MAQQRGRRIDPEQLERAILLSDLTLSAIAEAVPMSRSTLNDLRTGRRTGVRIPETVDRLAKVLQVRVERITKPSRLTSR